MRLIPLHNFQIIHLVVFVYCVSHKREKKKNTLLYFTYFKWHAVALPFSYEPLYETFCRKYVSTERHAAFASAENVTKSQESHYFLFSHQNIKLINKRRKKHLFEIRKSSPLLLLLRSWNFVLICWDESIFEVNMPFN